jgi:hypothetical protein
MRWRLGSQVLQLFRRGGAAEYLVAVRVTPEAGHDVAGSPNWTIPCSWCEHAFREGCSANNDLSSPFSSANAVGGDPDRAMAEVACLDVGVSQIAQIFQAPQLDLVLIHLGLVRRELYG